MSVPAEKLAQLNRLGFFIPLWWTPERIAYFDKRRKHWLTSKHPHYQLNPIVKESQCLAVSPVDTAGKCHFVAFDIDNGDPNDVARILEALPKCCVPFVSFSGKKGWHVWLFLSEPVEVEVAFRFAESIREKAGVACEVYPTGRKSTRCLKWLLSFHPETGKQEVFVPQEDLTDTTTLDTPLILQGLEAGHWRTPAMVVSQYAETNLTKGEKQNSSDNASVTAMKCFRNITSSGERKLLSDGVNLATIPEIAFGLAELCGRRVSRIGQAFRCILPGHEEKRPSASFWRGDNGTIVYHCFHHEKHGTSEFLILGEVYHAVSTGRIQKLSPVEAARWLCKLALRLGYETELVATTKEKLNSLFFILSSLTPLETTKTTSNIFTGCSPKGDWLVVSKVWEVVKEEALIQSMGGFEEICLSARFVAKSAKTKIELANKAVNFLCVLGLLEKVPNSGGTKGDRFILGNTTLEEARGRLEALFPDGTVNLRTFNRAFTAKRLGEEIAAKVFRRGNEVFYAENPVENPEENPLQAVPLLNSTPYQHRTGTIQAQGKHPMPESQEDFGKDSEGVRKGFGKISESERKEDGKVGLFPRDIPVIEAKFEEVLDSLREAEAKGDMEAVMALLKQAQDLINKKHLLLLKSGVNPILVGGKMLWEKREVL